MQNKREEPLKKASALALPTLQCPAVPTLGGPPAHAYTEYHRQEIGKNFPRLFRVHLCAAGHAVLTLA